MTPNVVTRETVTVKGLKPGPATKPKQPKDDGLTPEQRRERDAKALQEKAARKAARAAGNNDNSVGNKTNTKQ